MNRAINKMIILSWHYIYGNILSEPRCLTKLRFLEHSKNCTKNVQCASFFR